MTEQMITNQAELTAVIEQKWLTLQAGLAKMSEAQMTTLYDAAGWTVKDHVVHLAAWERSVLVLLHGRPRYEGLEVDEALYRSGDFEAMNAVIQQKWRHVSLAEALARLRETHVLLLQELAKLNDADLQRPFTDFLPGETELGDGRLLIDLIIGNTVDHFPEHLAWMDTLAAQA